MPQDPDKDATAPEPFARAEGLSRERIVWLVHNFYERVRQDDLLGPIFMEHLGEDWQPHLDRLVAFWSVMALGRGDYDGRPLEVHRRIALSHGLSARHFDRWLSLFAQTASEIGSAAAARFLISRAERMARAFRQALEIDPPPRRRPLDADEQARLAARRKRATTAG